MKFIPDGVTSKIALGALQVKSVSPKILFAAGVVGFGATVFLACRGTLKLNDILDERDITLARIEEAKATIDENPAMGDYPYEAYRKDKVVLHSVTVIKIAKLYAPALAVAAVSVTLLCGSHHILTKRNAALTAAYATIDKGFKEYRSRVVEELGLDKDREFLHGVTTEKVVEVDEDGRKKVVTKKTAAGTTMYGRLFNEHNEHWHSRPDNNLFFIRLIGEQLNDKLRTRGHVLLNDAYDELGFDRTEAGGTVGWLKDSNEGDGFIDFGIWDSKDALRVHSFLVGKEGELFLNFNVDGPILPHIGNKF